MKFLTTLLVTILITMATGYRRQPQQQQFINRPPPQQQQQQLPQQNQRFFDRNQQQQQQQQEFIPMNPSEFNEPQPSASYREPITAESGHGHGHGDYVDYGAYTGGWGAFGWYSDHPVGGGWH